MCVCYLLFCFVLFRTKKASVELHTYDSIDRSGKKRDEAFSEIKSPPTTDTAKGQSKVKGFTLSQCPAYMMVNSPSSARGKEDMENKDRVYATVD